MGLYSADNDYNNQDDDDIEIVSLLNNTPNPNNNGHYNDNDNNDNINIESTSISKNINRSKKRQRLILEECYKKKSCTMVVIISLLIVIVVVFFSPLISSSSSLSSSSSTSSSLSSLSDDDENNNNNNNNKSIINSQDENQQQQLLPPTLLPSQQPQQQQQQQDETIIIKTDASSSSAKNGTDIDNDSDNDNDNDGNSNTNNNNNNTSTTNSSSSSWFELHTGNVRIDRAYQLAKEEVYTTLSASSNSTAITNDDVTTSSTTPKLLCSSVPSSSLSSYSIELAGGLLLESDSLIQLLQSSTSTESIQFHDNDSDSDESNKLYTVWSQGGDDSDGECECKSDFDCCGSLGFFDVGVVDGIVGARGSWYFYLYTGNTTFLEWAYETTVASLYRAEQQQNNKSSKEDGLFYTSSCNCNRNSTTAQSQSLSVSLSTNILYYNGYYFAHKMGLLLMENSVTVEALRQRANTLKKKIRTAFWISDKRGYYTSNVKNGIVLTAEEQQQQQQQQTQIDILLGQSLMMLSDDFESNHRIQLILKKTPRTTTTRTTTTHKTATAIAMPLFVSSYFAIAAARNGHDDIFYEELDQQINLFEQQYNNSSTFPRPPELEEPQSSLLSSSVTDPSSSAGFLGMIYQGMFGMKFDINPNYILFGPTLLTKYSRDEQDGSYDCNETISLVNFKYKNAILDIYITGYGNQIQTFKINGTVEQPIMMLQQQQKEDEPYSYKLDSYVTGRQVIEIILI